MNAVTTITAPQPDGSLLNFVALAVKDPAIDVAKLETLLRMQREILADDARRLFNQAMAQVQSEMQPIVRDAQNTETRSRYARLATIDALMRPLYSRHGFCLSFDSEPIEGANIRIVCEVAHEGGHTKSYHLDAALDVAGPKGTPNKSPMHGLGSSVSYLRRYLTCMIFHIVMVDEDQDGNQPRQPIGRLTPAQTDELWALMRQTRTQEGQFLKVMAPGLRSIEQAPAADFPRLRNALHAKRDILAKRAAQAQQQGAAA